MDTTGKACVDFWKWAPKKGLVNANTASAHRVACSQVLGVLENWETLDVTALDVEDVFSRFVNLKGKKFSPDSLASYKSRFVRALSTFLDHSKNPTGWKPKIQSTPRREKATTNGSTVNGSAASVPDSAPTHQPTTSRTGLVDYPFPLREGRFAYLKLPADLNAADVKRLTAYLNTLALDDVA